MRTFWRAMAALRLAMGLAPESFWQRGLKAGGFPESPMTTWTASELSRGNSVDIAEAGRELAATTRRLDRRPRRPGAVIVTTKDTGVPPSKQRALAAAMSAPVFEVLATTRPSCARRRVQRPAAHGAQRRARPAGPPPAS